MNQRQKGYVGLGAMAVLAAVTIFGTDSIYKAVDNIGTVPVSYTAGTYTGTADGYAGPVSATVTVSDKAILSVDLKGDNETPGIGANALEQLPAVILEKQSSEIDAVTGATVTSTAVKNAVADALAQAKGEKAAAPAASGEKTAPVAAGNPADGAKFVPGTYTAKATGMQEMEVEVVVTESMIESIRILSHGETPGISDLALEQIPQDIIAAQGLGVDAVATATISSNAILAAVEDCLIQAGADVEALKSVGLAAKAQAEDEELEADIVIIGAGGAGLAAAVTANQAGATVIVLEKEPKVGGNTILAGGALNAVDDGSETALANDDSVQRHYDQTLAGGDNQGDPELVRIMVDNAWDGVEWLQDLGMEFKDGVFTVTGGLWPRAYKPVEPVGTGFFTTYNKYIDSHDGLDVMLNTEAVEIIRDGSGRVTTVVATGETGNKITVKAGKGVIVASGGFAKNVALREKYNTQWPTLDETIMSTNHAGATGDMIPVLEKLGAEFVQMENIQLLPLGDPKTGSLSGAIEHDVERRIFVNKDGRRFVNEGGRRDEMTLALFEQPDNYLWIVMDSDCYPTGDVTNNFNESIDDLIEQGRAVKGETLEELAAAMGVPEENLIAAVEDFNAHVETGEADEFGRTLYSTPIDDGPFYAGARVPTVHHTMGGVRINGRTQVLNKDGEPIPGLYAAGEVTGGIHGANRLGGNALTDTVVFGRIAGAEAASE